MKTVTEYRFFVVKRHPLKPGHTTSEYSLVNRQSNGVIGTIRWYGAWRQFCFFPCEGTVWSYGCLVDVQGFMDKIEAQRKAK